MFKFIIIFLLVAALFYLLKNKKAKNLNEVVKCESCGEIIAKKSSIKQDNKNYCSKNCLP